MKLYIANVTAQVQDFIYRVPETTSNRSQRIDIYSQQMLSGDLSASEIAAIVKQHAVYGLIPVDEIDRTKPFIGLCYSVDKPVAIEKIRRAIVHNKGVLEERGRDLRKEAAVVVNNHIEQQFEDPRSGGAAAALRAVELSVQEETSGTIDEHAPISEGTRVSRHEPPDATPRRTRGRRAAA